MIQIWVNAKIRKAGFWFSGIHTNLYTQMALKHTHMHAHAHIHCGSASSRKQIYEAIKAHLTYTHMCRHTNTSYFCQVQSFAYLDPFNTLETDVFCDITSVSATHTHTKCSHVEKDTNTFFSLEGREAFKSQNIKKIDCWLC